LPSNMIQGTTYTAKIEVRNDGDTDGFTVTPKPGQNRLVASPVTLQRNICAGCTETFTFSVTIGASASTGSYSEPVVWEVSAQHDGMVTKTDTYSGTYNVGPTPTGTGPNPTPPPGSSTVTRANWYDNLWLWLGVLFVILGAIFYRFGEDI